MICGDGECIYVYAGEDVYVIMCVFACECVPVQIRCKSHVSFPLSEGRWLSLIRRNRSQDLEGNVWDSSSQNCHLKLWIHENALTIPTVSVIGLNSCFLDLWVESAKKSKIDFVYAELRDLRLRWALWPSLSWTLYLSIAELWLAFLWELL